MPPNPVQNLLCSILLFFEQFQDWATILSDTEKHL